MARRARDSAAPFVVVDLCGIHGVLLPGVEEPHRAGLALASTLPAARVGGDTPGSCRTRELEGTADDGRADPDRRADGVTISERLILDDDVCTSWAGWVARVMGASDPGPVRVPSASVMATGAEGRTWTKTGSS